MDQTQNQGPSPAAETLARNLRAVVDDADALLKHAVASGDAQFDALRDRLSSQVRHMRLQLDEMEETAAHKARLAR